jgi:hypothetical protein
MNVADLVSRIRQNGGHPEAYVTAPRKDGSRTTIYGGNLTAEEWQAVLRMLNHTSSRGITPEMRARNRALLAADRYDD